MSPGTAVRFIRGLYLGLQGVVGVVEVDGIWCSVRIPDGPETREVVSPISHLEIIPG